MIQQDPILITGCPRSGASMVASVINICGAFIGTTTKRSMYCNDTISHAVVKPYLDRMGVDIKGQFPLPETYGITIPTNWRRMIENVMLYEGYESGQWAYKDSRSALIWPVWHHAFPNAKWVIVRRRTGDIVQSCLKTGFMSAFKNGANWDKTNSESEMAAWIWYVRQYERKFVEMINAGVNCKILWPERMISCDYQQLYELLDWLDLEWNPMALSNINVLLWGDTIERRKAI